MIWGGHCGDRGLPLLRYLTCTVPRLNLHLFHAQILERRRSEKLAGHVQIRLAELVRPEHVRPSPSIALRSEAEQRTKASDHPDFQLERSR